MKKLGIMQITRSPTIYLSIVGVTLICIMSVKPYMDKSVEEDVMYYLQLLLELSMSKKLITLCAALPSVALFCNDWSCQYIKPLVIRSGVRKYICSRCLSCFLSSFLTPFIGMMVFIAILSTKMPLVNINSQGLNLNLPFGSLAVSQLPILYHLSHILVFSLAMSLWAMVGLAVSSYIPNRFVAVTVPVVASYLIEELTGLLPPFLNTYYLTRSANVLGQGAIISLLYFVFFFVSASVLIGAVFYFRVKGRIRNEVV